MKHFEYQVPLLVKLNIFFKETNSFNLDMFFSYIGQPLDTACAHMFNVGKTGGLSYGK